MKGNSKKQKDIYMPSWLSTAIIITVAMFVISAVGVGICLALELADGDARFLQSQDYSKGNSGGSSGGNSGGSSGGSSSGNSNSSVQAGVNLPNNTGALCRPTTTKLNYLSKSNSDTSYITDKIVSNNTILVEVGSNTAIAEKNADQKIYPASMTKVMSLVVVCENITQKDLSKKLSVPQAAIDYKKEMGGSGEDLRVGESYTIKDLIYLLSYKSDTVASIMLAEHVGGTEAGFVKMMNTTAKKIGMSNTNFANCTGLHDENNYSTCRDIAALMIYALGSEFTREVLTTESYNLDTYPKWTLYPGWYSGDAKRFTYLTQRLDTVKVSGGKTGYEVIDGEKLYTYVSYAKGYDGKEYVNVIATEGKDIKVATQISDIKYVYNNYAK